MDVTMLSKALQRETGSEQQTQACTPRRAGRQVLRQRPSPGRLLLQARVGTLGRGQDVRPATPSSENPSLLPPPSR